MLALLLATLAWTAAAGGDTPKLEDPLYVSPEMAEYVASVVQRNAPPMLRLEQLVSGVFQANSLNFTYETETRSAAETFRLRSGNCLSFTAMFVAMARHVGLDVRFREVEVVPTWDKQGNVFLISSHVNVAAHIDGGVYVVDLFPRIDRFEIGGREVSDKRGLAHYYNNLGARHLSASDPEAAVEMFRKALECDPDAAFVWTNLGVAQTHLRQYGQAEDSYLRAQELDRHSLVAMSNLADLYLRLGRHQEAAKHLKRVEKFRNKNPYYHFRLGEEAFRSGSYRESIRHYRAALKRKDTDHRFFWALARAHAELGNTEETGKYLKKAARVAPDENGKSRYHQKLERLAAAIPVPPDAREP